MFSERFKRQASFGGAIALTIATIATGFAPTQAAARSYDGYCYQKNSNTRTKGTVIGAVAGAVIGSNVAGSGNRTEGSILGAVVGGVVGSQVGAQVKETNRSNCMSNRYYIYQSGYYAPPPPPKGYRVAYFYDRPQGMYYVKNKHNHHRR
jgi:uncharacterized protein YcfJ